jgi:hypothetical protein
MNDVVDPPLKPLLAPHVEAGALAAPPVVLPGLPMVRRRAVIVGIVVATVVALLACGAAWWHHQVVADPGLEFYGGLNVYRDEASTDHAGIELQDNLLGTQASVAFVPNGRLYVHFGLYNGGAHDVRIEDAPAGRYFYWGFDGMSLATDPDDGLVGVAAGYEPFHPFTLQRGQTVEVRLEYRLADCDPAELQSGTSSVRSVPLKYRTLGISRTARVPFRDSVVAVTAIGPCRNPIIES